MIRVVILLLAVLILYGVLKTVLRRSSADTARTIKIGLALLGGGLVILLIASGRLNWVVPLVGGLVALIARLLPQLLRIAPLLHHFWRQRTPSFRSHSANRPDCSVVEARFVKMELNHTSGEMNGEVLEGNFRGRQLNQLSLDELVALHRQCYHADKESAALMEAYLDRVHGVEWRTGQQHEEPSGQGVTSGAMSDHEACQVLGLSANPPKEAVIEAHRRLIQKFHPDRGGSTYLAAKINQARQQLL